MMKHDRDVGVRTARAAARYRGWQGADAGSPADWRSQSSSSRRPWRAVRPGRRTRYQPATEAGGGTTAPPPPISLHEGSRFPWSPEDVGELGGRWQVPPNERVIARSRAINQLVIGPLSRSTPAASTISVARFPQESARSAPLFPPPPLFLHGVPVFERRTAFLLTRGARIQASFRECAGARCRRPGLFPPPPPFPTCRCTRSSSLGCVRAHRVCLGQPFPALPAAL